MEKSTNRIHFVSYYLDLKSKLRVFCKANTQVPPNTRMEPTAPAGACEIARFLKIAFPTYRSCTRRGGGSCAGR
jgi:hypothetical protein